MTIQITNLTPTPATLEDKADKVHYHQISDVAGLSSQIGSKANIQSPVFTGTPQAPTADAGTSTQQIANTAFVMDAINQYVAPGSNGSYSIDVYGSPTEGGNYVWQKPLNAKVVEVTLVAAGGSGRFVTGLMPESGGSAGGVSYFRFLADTLPPEVPVVVGVGGTSTQTSSFNGYRALREGGVINGFSYVSSAGGGSPGNRGAGVSWGGNLPTGGGGSGEAGGNGPDGGISGTTIFGGLSPYPTIIAGGQGGSLGSNGDGGDGVDAPDITRCGTGGGGGTVINGVVGKGGNGGWPGGGGGAGGWSAETATLGQPGIGGNGRVVVITHY